MNDGKDDATGKGKGKGIDKKQDVKKESEKQVAASLVVSEEEQTPALRGISSAEGGAAGGEAADDNLDVEMVLEIDASLRAVLAAAVGFIAGTVGWLSVVSGRYVCGSGMLQVGEFTCWSISFMFVLDVLLWATLDPPPAPPKLVLSSPQTMLPCPPTPGVLAEIKKELQLATTITMTTTATTTTGAPVLATTIGTIIHDIPQQLLVDGTAWQSLYMGIRRVQASEIQLLGSRDWMNQPRLSHRNMLTVGVLLPAPMSATKVVEAATSILDRGGTSIVLVLHIAAVHDDARTQIINKLERDCKLALGNGHLYLTAAPPGITLPGETGKRDNLDYALQLSFSRHLSNYYMQVEPEVVMKANFGKSILDWAARDNHMPWADRSAEWNVVSFARNGFLRKMIRSKLLPRMAELLLLFPRTPADALFWDFVDMVSNTTAPKSCALAADASKRVRPDVILQYHKAECLIEHVGDVSSLDGKVQRLKEDYFKKHTLTSNLFDSPDAQMRTSLGDGSVNVLEKLYSDGRGDQLTQTSQVFRSDKVVHLEHGSEHFVELVFATPLDLEIVLLRMGGRLAPPQKNAKEAKRQETEVEEDFFFTLSDATLEFGRGIPDLPPHSRSELSCKSYEKAERVDGREVFWRSPQSNPVLNVRCVKVALHGPQAKPLVIREIRIRSRRHEAMQRGQRPGLPRLPGPAGLKGVAPPTLLPGKRSAQESPHASKEFEPSDLYSDEGRATESAATDRRSTKLAADAAALVARQKLDRWTEAHSAWALTVSVAFSSGAISGLLGGVAFRLLCPARSVAPTGGGSRGRKNRAA